MKRAMDAYRIVQARPEHLPALAGVERACARIFPPGVIPDAMLDDAAPVETLREAMAKGNLWVAESGDGDAVGFALVEHVEGNALLAELDVHPAHGRRGIGTALIRRVAEREGEAGRAALYLTTFAHIPWNAPFYSRLGFVVLGEGEIPDWCARILARERSYGLADRVAMRLAPHRNHNRKERR